MFPVEHKTVQGLYVAIAISMAIVFIIDLYTPLGIAVWVIYFVPLTLSFFTWRPLIPVALAVLASILMAIDFAIDPNPVGISPKLAGINRGFDILTVWIVAGAGHLFIRSKLAVRMEEWLQAGQLGLAEKMSGELRLEQLGENVLRFLAEYLDAQAGVLCDIAMPGEDGYSALPRVRALEHERGVTQQQQIPAIALTAKARSEDRLQALSAGFKMHVSKPVEPAELVIVIASVVGQRGQGATFNP